MLLDAVSNLVTISTQKYKQYIIVELQYDDQDIKNTQQNHKKYKEKCQKQNNTDMVKSNMAMLETSAHKHFKYKQYIIVQLQFGDKDTKIHSKITKI